MPERIESVVRFHRSKPAKADAVPVPMADAGAEPPATTPGDKIREIGGRKDGPDPTRYGDWEKNGRCIDF